MTMKYNVVFADGYDHHDFELAYPGYMASNSIAKIMLDGVEIGLVYELEPDADPTAFEAACDASNAVALYSAANAA